MISAVSNLTVRPAPAAGPSAVEPDGQDEAAFSSLVEAASSDGTAKGADAGQGDEASAAEPKRKLPGADSVSPDAAVAGMMVAALQVPAVAQPVEGAAADPSLTVAATPDASGAPAKPAVDPALLAAAAAKAVKPAGDAGQIAADAAQDASAGTGAADGSKVAAALKAAGVTKIVGESATETPEIAKPEAPKPPSPAGAAPVAVETKGAAAQSGGAKPAAKTETAATPTAGANAAAKDTSDKTAAAASDPQSQAATPDSQSAPAADRPATSLQTAAAPATASGQNTQAAAGASALAAHAAAQVVNEVASAAGARRTRFEIRLDPDELGRIDVRLDIQHDGRMSTRLIVEKAETLDLLKQDSRELQRQLEQSGFQLGQGGLSFQLRDGRRDDWRALADSQGLAGAQVQSEIEDAAPVADIYARASRRGASGVDMTV